MEAKPVHHNYYKILGAFNYSCPGNTQNQDDSGYSSILSYIVNVYNSGADIKTSNQIRYSVPCTQ